VDINDNHNDKQQKARSQIQIVVLLPGDGFFALRNHI